MPPPVKHSPVTKGRGNSPGVSKLPGWAADESAAETSPEATGAGPVSYTHLTLPTTPYV